MPLPTVIHSENIPSEKPVWCSLRGALEWMLFDLEPVSPDVEMLMRGTPRWFAGNDYVPDDEVDRAKRWLIIAMIQGRVRYWGMDYRCGVNHKDFINNELPPYAQIAPRDMSNNFHMIDFGASCHEGVEPSLYIFMHVGDLMRESLKDIDVEKKSSGSNGGTIDASFLPLTLDEAACLLAFQDHDRAYDEFLSNEEQEIRNANRRRMVRELEAGRIIARGKFGSKWVAPDDDEFWPAGWSGHAREAADILATDWEREGIDWGKSKLQTRHGEYVEIRVNQADILALQNRQVLTAKTPPVSQEEGLRLVEDNCLPEENAPSRRGNPRSDWPMIAALAAIICEREAGCAETKSANAKKDRIRTILEEGGYANLPGKTAMDEKNILGTAEQALVLYEAGSRKSPPHRT